MPLKLAWFELDAGGFKPLLFAAFARQLVRLSSDNAITIAKPAGLLALVLLKRRSQQQQHHQHHHRRRKHHTVVVAGPSTDNAINVPPLNVSNSLRTHSGSSTLESASRSVSSSYDESEDKDPAIVRDAVTAIDDQYVIACDNDGKIVASSTIVGALLDRHGNNTGRIVDSLLGGQKVNFFLFLFFF